MNHGWRWAFVCQTLYICTLSPQNLAPRRTAPRELDLVKPKAESFRLLLPAPAIPSLLPLPPFHGRCSHSVFQIAGLLPFLLSPLPLHSHHLKTHYNSIHQGIRPVLEFQTLPQCSRFEWNSAMKSRIDAGSLVAALSLFAAMRASRSRPDHFTLTLIIPAISSLPNHLKVGEAIHCLGFQMGFRSDVYFCNTLIKLYARNGFVGSAHRLFDEMGEKDVVSWTTLISGYVDIGDADESFQLFSEMRLIGFEPTSVSLAVMLRACYQERDVVGGRQLYGFVIKNGFESHELVLNSILTVFSKVGCLEEMEKLFHGIERRAVVSWNIMMSGYSSKGDASKIVDCFERMKGELFPSHESLTLVVSAFAKTGDILKGQRLHGYAVKSGLFDPILQSSFIDFYAKCGEWASSIQLFGEVKEKNTASWSVMMWAFIQNEQFGEAINLFWSMQIEGFKPCNDTLRGLVRSYTHLGAIQLGKTVHAYLIRNKFGIGRDDISLETSMLNMYVKCGSIVLARRAFDQMFVKDVIALSSMIEGYAVHGLGLEALKLFDQMQEEGIIPNSTTFLSLLTACSHSGLVTEGCEVFDWMTRKYGINPELNHYTCVVDLLGRSGKLYEAFQVIKNMRVEPDGRIWGALLASCRMYSDSRLGTYAAQRLFDLEPDNVGYHVVLSNIHASDDKWDAAEDIRNLMAKKEVKKKPGWSCIEVKGAVHMFVAGDVSYLQAEEIHRLLQCFSWQFEKIG